MSLSVVAVAWTHFAVPDDPGWTTDAEGGQALAEFAGRACYETWDKPNPATATNAGYVRHLLEVGHHAVFEHASATFWVRGLSRGCARQLARHRHLSLSELSPRHVPDGDPVLVETPDVAADPDLHAAFATAAAQAGEVYRHLLATLEHHDGPGAGLADKQARQIAAAVLPVASATQVVVTGNHRAWRHVVAMHAGEHADVELRMLAIAVLRELQRLAPHVFADFEITRLPDGTEVASSPLVLG